MRRSRGSSSEPNGASRAGPSSSRWLAISRAACSAEASLTVTRSSFSENGKGVRAMSEVTIAGMPWASSRPRTTSASIGDGVRKITTRSASGSSTSDRHARRHHQQDLHQDHCHVVVLVGGADERFDLAQDALAQLAGLEVAVLLDDRAEPIVAEQIARRIHRLGDPIRVEHDDIPRIEPNLLFFQQLRELL